MGSNGEADVNVCESNTFQVQSLWFVQPQLCSEPEPKLRYLIYRVCEDYGLKHDR